MLCGANGSGKTTLMKALADKEETPCILHESGCECIMIPARIPKVAGFTLREFVRISCFSKSDLYGKLSKEEESAMDKAIADLGLSHLADRDISTLSDGEFQKAGIASALVRKASVIMLDEPTAFLDAQNRISVLATLKDICTSKRPGMLTGARIPAVIFSTHDLHDGLQACSRVFAIGADCSFNISTEDTPESKSAAVSSIFR
jgi:ABC-type cobalamin/Fe3+-siderophores transport system ATPase subunit